MLGTGLWCSSRTGLEKGLKTFSAQNVGMGSSKALGTLVERQAGIQ